MELKITDVTENFRSNGQKADSISIVSAFFYNHYHNYKHYPSIKKENNSPTTKPNTHLFSFYIPSHKKTP